jgi:hypothetical protein
MLNDMIPDILGKATDCEIPVEWAAIMIPQRKPQSSDNMKHNRLRNSNLETNYLVLFEVLISCTANVDTSESLACSGEIAVSHKNSNVMYSLSGICSTVVSGQTNVGIGALWRNQMSTFSTLSQFYLFVSGF